MSGRKTITYLNFLRGIPAPIVALGGMIKEFLFYPLSCVTVQKIQPETSQKLYVTQNFLCVTTYSTRTQQKQNTQPWGFRHGLFCRPWLSATHSGTTRVLATWCAGCEPSGVHSLSLVCLLGGVKREGSKIERGGAAWVLKGGRHFVNTCNNQIKLVKAMEGESVRTRGWGGTRGGALFRRFGRRNKLTKNKREGDGVVALDGRC